MQVVTSEIPIRKKFTLRMVRHWHRGPERWGISVLRDIQDLARRSPGQPDLSWLCF